MQKGQMGITINKVFLNQRFRMKKKTLKNSHSKRGWGQFNFGKYIVYTPAEIY